MNKEFVPYEQALALKELGFDEPCFGFYTYEGKFSNELSFNEYKNTALKTSAPLYQQAINFLYICSNKQIDIELKGSDTHEERIRKIEQGCKDLWSLQNNKSKQ
jgi:hypothetical protein